MGFFSKIGNWIKRVFGIKSKQKELPELPKKQVIPKVEIIEGKKTVGISTEDNANLETVIKYKELEQEVDKEISKIDKFKKKNYAIKSNFVELTDEKKREYENLINTTGKVIRSGYYSSYEDLLNSKYDIYRNILMRAISKDNPNSQQIIQNIYQSGILNEHIVGEIRLIVRSKDGEKYTTKEFSYEIQGLTPDKAINTGLHNVLLHHTGTMYEIRGLIERTCGLAVSSDSSDEKYNITNEVIGVSICFNYA